MVRKYTGRWREKLRGRLGTPCAAALLLRIQRALLRVSLELLLRPALDSAAPIVGGSDLGALAASVALQPPVLRAGRRRSVPRVPQRPIFALFAHARTLRTDRPEGQARQVARPASQFEVEGAMLNRL